MGAWGNEVEIKELNSYFVETSNWRGGGLYGFGTSEFLMTLRCESDFLLAYNNCAPLKAIIGRRAKATNSGKIEIVNQNTQKAATGRKELKARLDRPNILQRTDQFFAQQNIYIDIFGYCPILSMVPAGFENIPETVPTAIWNLPPWLFDLDYTTKWLNQYEATGIYQKFYIYWNGEKIELDMRNVKFIFDDGIGTENDSNLLIPDSRLVGLEYPVSNIIAAYKSRNTLATKRGAIGILSNESEDASGTKALKKGEKEELQKEFSKYGLVGQPYQIIVSDARLKWQQMGFPTSELMLFEEVEDSMNRLCDAYGYPPALIARSNDTTYDNKKQARRDLLENTIEPESKSRLEQFTDIIAPGDTIDIRRNYRELSAFQEDEKLRADNMLAKDSVYEKRYKNGLITKNMWLEAIGEEPINDPSFGEYYGGEPTQQQETPAAA